MFAQPSQAFREGGKIHDFICKHARGGYLSECGCKQEGGQVESAQKGKTLLGRLYNKYIGRYMPNTLEANNRRVRTWTDENGVQHIVESANINGNSTDTYIDINGADTSARQKITTGVDRYRSVVLQPGTPEWRAAMSRNVISKNKQGGKVEKAQNGESKLGDSKKEKDRQTVKQNLEKAKKTSDAIKESHKTSDSGWKYNWARERILNGRNGKLVNGTIQEIYHTGVNGVHGTLDTREGDSLLTGYPVLRTIGKIDVMNGEPGWDLARDKWFEILRSNRTTPYAESMQNNLDRERINHPKPKKDEQGGQVEKAQKGKSKLSTPVTTQPKDSTQVEYILNFPGKNGKETVAFTDANGNDIAWSHNRRDDTYSWSHAGERMRFNPNQNDDFIPYSSFKQRNTGIEGSTYLSPEDTEKLKVLFEYAKNYRRPREPKYSWDSSLAERFWYMLKDKAVTQPPAGTPTLKEQLFRKNGGKVEKAQSGKKVNNKKRTITEVDGGLSKYDAEEMGIDPNTIVPTGSIITAYPNTKPYIVNGQVPFNKRNGLVFNLGGVESREVEDGSVLGGGVPGRKYKISSITTQDDYYPTSDNYDSMRYPFIMRYASPKDTIYNLGFEK